MPSLHPSADGFQITVPVGESPFLRDRIEPIVIEAGGHEVVPGLFSLGDGGKVKFHDTPKVGVMGVSGAALAALRAAGLFLPLLGAISECPHRVTKLDIALDIPAEAGPRVRRLYRQASAGKLQFTRKRLPGLHCRRIESVGIADGKPTGTVYVGKRTSSIWARVYDKRDELLSRAIKQHGSHPDVIELNDPGPLTRYELVCGRKIGMTLRDVADPTALFWHFGSDLLKRPAGVPAWEPHSMGYELPRHEPDPMRQLRFLLESSPDVKRVLRLVHAIGGPEPSEGLKQLRGFLIHRIAA